MKHKILNAAATTALATLLTVGAVFAATTISTNINTGGTLTVTGVSNLTGLLTAAGGIDTVGSTTDLTLQNDETITNGTNGIITLTGQAEIIPTRVSGNYAYGVDINPDEAFFTGGSATKSYLLSVRGDRPSGSAATGDSNDALAKFAGNNYAANDSNFIFRGLNTGINNRSGGTLGILEGASIGAQNKSGGTSPTVRGLTVTSENYGTTAAEFGGIDIVLKNEAAVATTEYGLRIRNLNNSISDAVGAGILLSDTGVNTGWDYGLDMNGASITAAEIRLSNGETIANTTNGNITLNGILEITAIPFGSLPSTCTPGSIVKTTGSDNCTGAGGADGALCVCAAAGNAWALLVNY